MSSNLNQTQKTEVRELISQYQGVFSSMPGLTRREEHEIRVSSSRPVRMPPYRIPVAYIEKVHQELRSMAELGIIEHSKSPWASPLVSVQNKDGRV